MEVPKMKELQQKDSWIPVLPLRDVVVYPHMVIPLFVGRERSIDALDAAMKYNKQVLLVAQKEAEVDEPDFADLYQVGTLANILQLLKLPDGTVKVLVEGSQRSKVLRYQETGRFFSAEVERIDDVFTLSEQEQDVLQRTVINSFDQYVKLNNKIPPEVLNALAGIDDPSRLADTMAAHMSLKVSDKQGILEAADIEKRLEDLMVLMEGEVDLLEMEKKIRVRVKQQMEKNQREYYLNEQMKAIQKNWATWRMYPMKLKSWKRKLLTQACPRKRKPKRPPSLISLS